MADLEQLRELFSTSFPEVLKTLSALQGFEVSSDFTKRSEEVLNSVFEDNPERISGGFHHDELESLKALSIAFFQVSTISPKVPANLACWSGGGDKVPINS